MNGINWEALKAIVHEIGIILIVIWAIKFLMCIITNLLCKTCSHCGKKL